MRLVDIDDIRVMMFPSEEDDPSESDGEREYRNGWNDALTAINDIQPSAQPTEASCWGCNCPKMERMLPSAEPELATNLQQSCNQLATDTISRKTAIDALEKVADFFPWRVPGKSDTYDRYNEGWNDAIGRAEMEIETLPSAEPVRMKGKWVKAERRGCITYSNAYAECTRCHGEPTYLGWGMKFCPNCGASMSEGRTG